MAADDCAALLADRRLLAALEAMAAGGWAARRRLTSALWRHIESEEALAAHGPDAGRIVAAAREARAAIVEHACTGLESPRWRTGGSATCTNGVK